MRRKSSLLSPETDKVPDSVWNEAVRRADIIRPLAEHKCMGRADVSRAATQLGLSTQQTYRLIHNFRANPITEALVPRRAGRKKGMRFLQPEVEQLIERGIEKFYKTREKPRLKALYRHIQHDCRASGLRPPSINALSARINAHSLKELVKAREGADAAHNRFAPVRGGIRTKSPLQVIQIDHTEVDLQLTDEILRKVLGRPWLTLVLELHTRSVLGFYISLDPPSATSVAMAISNAVLPKEEWLSRRNIELTWPMHGLMNIIHLDNAREFHSRALSRGCEQHGIRLTYRDVGKPHHGGHIERLMGTLMRRTHALPGTTFSNIAERGDYDSEARAILTLQEFERIFALELLGPYHHDFHSGIGKTPASAWSEWISAGGSPIIPVNRGSFVIDFLPFEERVVGREGIRLFNIHYYDGSLAIFIGQRIKLRVKYDPRDLSAVFIEMPGGGHLRTPYADLGRPPISLWEHRYATRRLRAEGKLTINEQAIFAAIAEQRNIIAEAYRSSKVARRQASRLVHGRRESIPGQNLSSAVKTQQPHSVASDAEAKVPTLTEDDFNKMEF